MKSRLYIFSLGLFLVSILLGSCSKYDVRFEIDAFGDMIIPAGANALDIFGIEAPVVFQFQQQLDIVALTAEDISEVVAISAIFQSKFGEEDLSFLQVVEILALDPTGEGNPKEVFYYDPIPLGPRTRVELFPSLPNIKEYIQNDQLQLRIECTFRRPPPKNYDIRIDMVFGAIQDE